MFVSKPLDCVVLLLGVKVVKGFVIVTAEFLFGFSLELGQLSPVPEQQMIGQPVRRSASSENRPRYLFSARNLFSTAQFVEAVHL